MRKYFYLGYDLACICGALLAALYLRHGFPLIQEGALNDLYLLLLVSFIAALAILPLMRTHTSLWRFTSAADLANILIAVALVVVVTNSGLFLISRLHMMPRSVPPMHWALAVVAMGGSRLLARQLFGPARALAKNQSVPKQHVIVVGACQTAELYLQFIKRIIQHEIIVEGLVDSDKSLTNRIFQKHKIFGTPDNIPLILEQFLVHGIEIRQIILAQLLDDLPYSEKTLLLEMETSGLIELVHFGKHMGIQAQPSLMPHAADYYETIRAIAAEDDAPPSGYYPYLKRALDMLLSLVLITVFMPLMALTSVLVALDVGMPMLFWQQRPGFHGKPFRLYKFRTMHISRRRRDEDRLAHKSGDITRTSTIGRWLRHLRLDELPQLFHILVGTMSFVGPRPLLPDDQPEGGYGRLSIRPGVTGWAQIHGGDALTPAEKLVLDLWYIRNISFLLDLRIMLRTLIVILKADKPQVEVIKQTMESVRSVHEQL